MIRGNALTLSATGVADGDGTVTKVEFYRDVNQNGAIDPSTDILLGADTAGTDGWTWTASTSDFPTGTNAFLARAQDDDLLWSGTASATVLVNAPVKQSPTIGSLGLSPNRVVRPAPITLTANSVVDPDGQVETVEFYRDANGNGTLETDTDELLGTDIDGSDGWTWAGPTTNFPTGFNRYFARAQDNDDRWSNTVTATGVVTLSNLQDSELPKASSNPPDVVNSGGKRYEFDVHYTDNVALDVSTLGNSDVRVYCPQNGFNKTATFLRFTPETGGASVTATYYITPPGGSWDSIDNAVYQVLMVAGQVSDTSGHDVESGLLGEFVVNVPPSIASSFPAFTPLGTAASANETDDSMNREIEIAYLDTAFADW